MAQEFSPPLDGDSLTLYEEACGTARRLGRNRVDLVSLALAAAEHSDSDRADLVAILGASFVELVPGLATALTLIGSDLKVRRMLSLRIRWRERHGWPIWKMLTDEEREALLAGVLGSPPDGTALPADMPQVSGFGAPASWSRDDNVMPIRSTRKIKVAARTSEAFDPDELSATLSSRVRGQDRAVAALVERYALAQSGLALDPRRPKGVFLFVGPTGVGKTALARAFADAVAGPEGELIRIDMSEHRAPHTTSLLIGSPPGYAGCDSPSGWLVTKIGKKPTSVVLLDEWEKAHPDVWNIFLQVYDAGHLTDSQGRRVDCSSAVFIMTSNLGSTDLLSEPMGFSPSSTESRSPERDDAVLEAAVCRALPPELLNRIDAVVPFRALSERDITDIADIELSSAIERAAQCGWQLRVTADAKSHIATRGYDQNFGVRGLRRLVEHELMRPLVMGKLPPGPVTAELAGDQIRLQPNPDDGSEPSPKCSKRPS